VLPARGNAGAVVGEQCARWPAGVNETRRSRRQLDRGDVTPRGLIIARADSDFGATLIASTTMVIPGGRLRPIVTRASKGEVRHLSRAEHIKMRWHASAGIVAQDVLADGSDLHPTGVDDRETHAPHFKDLREQLHVDPPVRCLYAGDLRLVDSDQTCKVALTQVAGAAQPTHYAGHIEHARSVVSVEPGRVSLRPNSLIHHDTASRNINLVVR
jgi:hypothetical protein